MPKIEYTDDEMKELRQTFQAYAKDGSGLLTPRRAVECIADLKYNFNESVVTQILSDQSKDRSQVMLDFNDFVNFVDVVGAIDAYVIEHLTDLIQGLPTGALEQILSKTGLSDAQQLISHLSGLVRLGTDDSFKFSEVYELLGYEDIDQPETEPEASPPQPSRSNLKAPTPEKTPRKSNLKTDFLTVPVDAAPSNLPKPTNTEESSRARNLSVRFDIEGTKQFRLPTLAIPTDDDLQTQQEPLRTMNANPKPISLRRSFSDKNEDETAIDSDHAVPTEDKSGSKPGSDSDSASPKSPDTVLPASNALVVPSMAEDLHEEDIAYVHDAFATFLTVFDRDHDGAIAVSELGAALRMLGLDPSDEQLQDLFTRADIDRNGMIDFGEFCLYYKQMLELEFKDGVPLHHIKSMFSKADADNDGEMSREEFAHIIRKEFPSLSNANIEQLLEVADSNSDGIIDFEEFVSFLNRPDKSSRKFARKLFRAHLPSPIEYLTAFGKMPSNFRPSALANLQHESVSFTKSHVAPVLEPDSLGLQFRDLRTAEASSALAPIVAEVCVQIELIGAEGIPIPIMNRHRIVARRARIALFCGDSPISCQYIARAHWSSVEEDRWKFAFPTSFMHILIAKSSQKQPFLLIELSVLVQDESGPKRSEMTCGFATIDLGGEMLSKTVTESVPVSGGTFKAKTAIKRDEIVARREGWRRLTTMFKGKPLPTVTLKIGPLADAKQKEHSYRVPNDIIAPLCAIEVLHLFMEILADATIRCARPFVPATSQLQQDAPLRIFLDHIVNSSDALEALAESWKTQKKNLSRQARKKLNPGTPNDFVKSEFRKTITRMWPVLTSALLPESDVGKTDHERLSMLTYCAKENEFEQFISDGLNQKTGDGLHRDLSKSLVFRPFHTDEIAFTYDMYQPDQNPFGALEREIRETCDFRE